MEWKKGLSRLMVVLGLLACVPVEDEKGDDDDQETTEIDDREDEDDDREDDDNDDNDDLPGEDDDDSTSTGYDAACALGVEAFCLCGPYYDYQSCTDDDRYYYYDLCVTGQDGGILECFADYVDEDYYVDCYGAMTTCG
jgi:hypothetical protein